MEIPPGLPPAEFRSVITAATATLAGAGR